VVFLGTFTNGDTKIQFQNGELKIHGDGVTKKFVDRVQQITFSGKTAFKYGQNVIYITERCVFKLVEDGTKYFLFWKKKV
jgi:propionate CoA-transferase